VSGVPFSAQRRKGEKQYDVLYLGVSVPKEELYARLDERIDLMMKAGLLEEVTRLARTYSFDVPGMNSIGYREFRPYLEGVGTLADAVVELKKNTRQYAKRQMTWFARRDDILWCQSYEDMERRVAEFLKK
jgi:tRNA dimethylallyltransferase